MAHQQHQSCIEACVRCAQECEHCADACLSEADVQAMAECIRLDRDCAEACWLAAAFMSRGSRFAAPATTKTASPFRILRPCNSMSRVASLGTAWIGLS